MIRIDKNVPAPTSGSGRRTYPWAEMKVGDSFFVPGKTQQNLSATACGWAHRHNPNAKFKTAKRTEGGVTGARVWRTA